MSSLDVECPICGAEEGVRCPNLGGYYHRERLHAAEEAEAREQRERSGCITISGGNGSSETPPFDPVPCSGGTQTINVTMGHLGDKLNDLMNRQSQLMRRYGEHPEQLHFRRQGTREQVAEKLCVAAAREAFEMLDELPWRSWRDPEPVDREKLLIEVADLLHFALAVAILYDCSAEELHQIFCFKNDVNIERINERLARREERQ